MTSSVAAPAGTPRPPSSHSPRPAAASATTPTNSSCIVAEDTPQPPVLPIRHALQQLLPTCQRCRRLRRRCDTQLPNCRPCQRAGAECTIFDHALKQTLPRAYVQSLLIRVEHLEAVKNGTTGPAASRPNGVSRSPTVTASGSTPAPGAASPSTLSIGGSRGERTDGTNCAPASASSSATPTVAGFDSFDVVVPSAASTDKSRYWGASSVFALTVEILQHATARGFLTAAEAAGEDGAGQSFVDEPTQLLPHTYEHAYGDAEDNHHPSLAQGEAPPEDDIRALLQLYLVSANQLYGFVDPAQVEADLAVYLVVRRGRGDGMGGGVSAPSPPQVHPYFRIAMMCAIACATRARYRPPRTAESLAYYADAAAYVEEVTAEVSPASLQALLLLIVFCLFYPRRGNMWKLLDYACRLTIELGYHTEGGDEDEAEGGDSGHGMADGPGDGDKTSSQAEREAARTLRRSTFWGLYAIERIVGQLFGRGSDLPETIITAAYPSALAVGGAVPVTPGIPGVSVAAVDGLDQLDRLDMDMLLTPMTPLMAPPLPIPVPVRMPDQPTLQAMSIAHHYRLVYLRSEIFRSLYLPAVPSADGHGPGDEVGGNSGGHNGSNHGTSTSEEDNLLGPGLGLTWLRNQHHTLLAWRHELRDVGEDLAGVATVTCDVGYDATMCFLFQPLLLRALRATADDPGIQPAGPTAPNGSAAASCTTPILVVASDPFYSSIRLIRTYEKIIRAPEHSALGCYPMTFMSAHYIYLASSTLLAHALLRLDGRTHVLPPMGDTEAALRRTSTASPQQQHQQPQQKDHDQHAGDGASSTELDWGAFVDISSSCLILLAWCGERWPGLLGMLGVYQRLFSRLIRQLIQKGVVL